MKNIALYSWENSSLTTIGIFGDVIVALIGGVILMMNSDKKK